MDYEVLHEELKEYDPHISRAFRLSIAQSLSNALSTLAGMTVGHYQLFKFSLASEAVLPDNRIVLAPHFRSCPPLPFPPCVLERVMGTMFARRARPIVWTGLDTNSWAKGEKSRNSNSKRLL